MSIVTIPSLTIRPARPDDAPLAAQLLYLSMDAPANLLFGVRAGCSVADMLAALFTCEGGRLSFRHASIAEADGKVAGLLIAYPAKFLTRLDLETGRHVLALSGLTSIVHLIRRLFPYRNVREAEGGEYYVSNLAVLPRLQRRGVGACLLACADEQARAAGLQKCSLMVTLDNDGARRLYERMGYRVVFTHRVSLPNGMTDTFQRMVKHLS